MAVHNGITIKSNQNIPIVSNRTRKNVAEKQCRQSQNSRAKMYNKAVMISNKHTRWCNPNEVPKGHIQT